VLRVWHDHEDADRTPPQRGVRLQGTDVLPVVQPSLLHPGCGLAESREVARVIRTFVVGLAFATLTIHLPELPLPKGCPGRCAGILLITK
jgi:hypothetical protein